MRLLSAPTTTVAESRKGLFRPIAAQLSPLVLEFHTKWLRLLYYNKILHETQK